MVCAWRIERAHRGAGAFSGEGTRLYGGRWNSPSVRVVYLSEHRSLAALELFIHTQPLATANEYVVIGAEWDDALVERFPTSRLPRDWRVSPPGPDTVAIGDRWVREARFAVLALPSAIIPNETNFLLNPLHPDFHRVRILKPAGFRLDPRMLQR